jgi:ribosome biogenesis SPOUT family RNA methylase Rps3
MSSFPYFIIEHIEDEFSKDFWCSIEYQNILRIVTPKRLIITNMSAEHQANLPESFMECAAITSQSLIEFLAGSPVTENAALAGLATSRAPSGANAESRICFLDEQGTGPLAPADVTQFDYIIVGGILGDHPPRDRGGHLRGLGFAVRHLGPRQMSTDTAVLACATVLRHQTPIDALSFHDDPEVYADEIDAVPKGVLAAKAVADATDALCGSSTGADAAAVAGGGAAAVNANKAESGGYRESTRIRMRYLTQKQPALGAAVALDPALGLDEATGHWELSKPESQRALAAAPVDVPRITPGLLKHIFESADLEIDLADFQIGDEELAGEELDDEQIMKDLFPEEEL